MSVNMMFDIVPFLLILILVFSFDGAILFCPAVELKPAKLTLKMWNWLIPSKMRYTNSIFIAELINVSRLSEEYFLFFTASLDSFYFFPHLKHDLISFFNVFQTYGSLILNSAIGIPATI